uniref:Nanos-type domain-containing protein n=1 Tax=Onchocerca volvulus TaxID=6282 RepID=A0A2K6WNZ7_ONCVO
MDTNNRECRSEPEKENSAEQGNNEKKGKNQKQYDQKKESDHKRNRSEALHDLRNDLDEEYKPFDNGYDSPLSSPIIREKIESVLHFTSLPLVEHGTLESQLYDSWRTIDNISMSSSLPTDFFSVEHIQRRERELYNYCEPGNHLLQNLIDLVESAVPSVIPRRMSPEGKNTIPKTDLLDSIDHQADLQESVTSRNDNFGNNFRSPPFSPLRFPSYLPVASRDPISNHPAQFDSFIPNLNSSLFGTSPITPTSSHLPPGNLQSDLQSIRPSTSTHPCRYCMAIHKFPQDHDKKECPKLACMKPCKICHASGPENHTLIESPILRIIRSVPLAWWFYNIILEHCPFKKKIVLKLKSDKRNDGDKDNKDNKDDDKNDKNG